MNEDVFKIFKNLMSEIPVGQNVDNWRADNVLRENLEYGKWLNVTPFLSIPEDFEIQPIPNFGLAVARFRIRKKGNPKKAISVYLDCYDNLGCYGAPYWEAYPVNGDTFRCSMTDVADLIQTIVEELNK